MTDARHPDVLTAAEAVEYLRLDQACESPDAARRALNAFCKAGRVAPLKWGKSRLFSRKILDAFVEAEVAALTGASDTQTEGKGGVQTPEGHSAADGTPDGH